MTDNWETDIASYATESARTADGFNLLDAIRTEYGGTEAEAFDRAMVMWARIMALFLRLRSRLATGLPHAVPTHPTGLGTSAAHLLWDSQSRARS